MSGLMSLPAIFHEYRLLNGILQSISRRHAFGPDPPLLSVRIGLLLFSSLILIFH